VTAIVQNASPYTYFGDRPVDMGEGATLDSGDLAGVVLERASPIDIPTIIWRALSRRARVARHRRVHAFTGSPAAVRSLDERPLPLQVDGDYIGEVGGSGGASAGGCCGREISIRCTVRPLSCVVPATRALPSVIAARSAATGSAPFSMI
jgi:hypothetical protein